MTLLQPTWLQHISIIRRIVSKRFLMVWRQWYSCAKRILDWSKCRGLDQWKHIPKSLLRIIRLSSGTIQRKHSDAAIKRKTSYLLKAGPVWNKRMFYDGTHKYNGHWPAFLTYLTYFTPNTADCSSFFFIFFHFFSFFLPANGSRFANSKRINVSIQGTVVFYLSRRRMVMPSVCFSERTSFFFRVISIRPSLSV